VPETTDPYVRDLVVALRARDVPGPRIGEVIAEVEDHLAESGEAADDAFGTPEEYAATIAAALPPAADAGSRRLRRSNVLTWLCTYAVALGAMLTGAGVVALVIGHPLGLTLNWAVAAALLPPVALTFVRLLGGRRPALARAWLLGAVAALALFVQFSFLPFVLPWRVSSVVALAAGLALLGLGVAGLRTDRVIDPRTGAGRFELTGPARRRLLIAVLAGILGPLLVIGVFAVTAR
jgi:hypothetical protein